MAPGAAAVGLVSGPPAVPGLGPFAALFSGDGLWIRRGDILAGGS